MPKKYNYTKKTGRPAKYTKKEQVKEVFEKYVANCVENHLILTKAGFLAKLDISRESYNKYKKRKEFIDTIRRIELLIEDVWIQRLTATGATGAIFYLKNAFKEEYKDRTETDITSGGKPIPILGNVSNNQSGKKDNGTHKKD